MDLFLHPRTVPTCMEVIHTCTFYPSALKQNWKPLTQHPSIKWKPSTENTIDFKLGVRFPPSSTHDSTHKTSRKPFFELYLFKENGHEYFDWFEMPDDEWERWKESGEQLDDQVVECAWHPPSPHNITEPTWHLKRTRSDKSHANHYTTVNSVIQSIADGVDLEQV